MNIGFRATLNFQNCNWSDCLKLFEGSIHWMLFTEWIVHRLVGIHNERRQVLNQGPISWKPWKLLGPAKPFLVHLYLLKKEEVYTPETSCMKGTSVHIKEMWIKLLCNHKVWDFAMAFPVRKFSGPSRKGPQERNDHIPTTTRAYPGNVKKITFICEKRLWYLNRLVWQSSSDYFAVIFNTIKVVVVVVDMKYGVKSEKKLSSRDNSPHS